MADVQNLDDLAYPIEYLVRVANDEHHSDLRVVCSVSAQRMFAQLRYGIANARSDIRAPTGERSRKYSMIRSRSENARGV